MCGSPRLLATGRRVNATGLPTTPDAAALPTGENRREADVAGTGPKLLLPAPRGSAYASSRDCMESEGGMDPLDASVGERGENGTTRAIGGRSVSIGGAAHTQHTTQRQSLPPLPAVLWPQRGARSAADGEAREDTTADGGGRAEGGRRGDSSRPLWLGDRPLPRTHLHTCEGEHHSALVARRQHADEMLSGGRHLLDRTMSHRRGAERRGSLRRSPRCCSSSRVCRVPRSGVSFAVRCALRIVVRVGTGRRCAAVSGSPPLPRDRPRDERTK